MVPYISILSCYNTFTGEMHRLYLPYLAPKDINVRTDRHTHRQSQTDKNTQTNTHKQKKMDKQTHKHTQPSVVVKVPLEQKIHINRPRTLMWGVN